MAGSRLQILTAGLEDHTLDLLEEKVLNADLTNVQTVSEFEGIVDSLTPGKYHVVLCGPALAEISPAELAQTFKSLSKETPVFYVPLQRQGIDFKIMRKHGYDDVFVLPFEEGLFGRTLREIERAVTGTAKVVYHAVPVMDFDEDSVLDFSVSLYLPMNKKHVKMFKPGAKLTKEQVDKFKKHQVSSLNVDETELDKFVTYSAVRLKELGKFSSQSYSAKQKLQTTVRDLFRTLIAPDGVSFDDGKELMENSQKIVAEFTSSKPARALYDQLLSTQGPDDDIYSHCGRVSTLAALLSLGTGIGQPQDLAIAGLFHDLGKTRLEPVLLRKPFEELLAEQKAEYWRYPELSLEILQEKKMGVSQRVRNIILQQGERADGRGYPHELPEHKIDVETFLLILADRLDCAMQTKEGKPRPKLEHVLALPEMSANVATKVWAAVHALLIHEVKAA